LKGGNLQHFQTKAHHGMRKKGGQKGRSGRAFGEKEKGAGDSEGGIA